MKYINVKINYPDSQYHNKIVSLDYSPTEKIWELDSKIINKLTNCCKDIHLDVQLSVGIHNGVRWMVDPAHLIEKFANDNRLEAIVSPAKFYFKECCGKCNSLEDSDC